jgi:hypothetical protein
VYKIKKKCCLIVGERYKWLDNRALYNIKFYPVLGGARQMEENLGVEKDGLDAENGQSVEKSI